MTTPLDISDFVYQTGTLTIAATDTTAVFTGSSLSANIKDGDYLFAGGALAPIQTVTDDTHVELFTGWAGADVTAGTYLILKASLLRYHTALIGYDSASFLALLDGTTVWYAVDGDEPDPSIGEEGQRALKSNVTPWKVWLKTGGVWVLQSGSPGGPGADGATILVQDSEPDTSHAAGSLWLDSDSADLDVYQLGGSPLAWEDTGVNLKGSTGPAAWLPPEAWVTATDYAAGPPAGVVTQGGETYVCLEDHASGTFSTDLAAGKWIKVAAKGADGADGASALTVVRVAVSSNVVISTALENGDTLDGLTLATNDLVLLMGQTAGAENGVYVVAASGAASRATVFDTYDEHPGRFFSPAEGTNKGKLYHCTSAPGGTLGTTDIVVDEFSSGGGDVAGDTHAATSKTTPVDADELPLVDSAASNVLKKLTWANLKAALGFVFASAAQGAKADSAVQTLVEGTNITIDATDPHNPIVSALGGGASNRLINPNGTIWQRANSGAAAITDGLYAFDRWYGLTQSAGVTASQVSNAENGTLYMMRLSQANATAQRFGIAQAIESANCIDMRGQDVTLSARVRMSASTTLRYAIIEWTGTADTITKDVVADWTNSTFTPGNFFNSTSITVTASGSTALTANTLASISLTGTVSGSANNVIVFFWTDSTQAQNVTLDVGKVQLEKGASATPLAVRLASVELDLCYWYYQFVTAGADDYFGMMQAYTSTNAYGAFMFLRRMHHAPSVTSSAATDFQVYAANGSDLQLATIAFVNISRSRMRINVTVASGMTAGQATMLRSRTGVTGGIIAADAEL